MGDEKAIGGYFELDPGLGNAALPDGVLLNSGRNALRHIVRKLNIRSIHIPYYICPVVADALVAEGCDIDRYFLDENMFPDRTFPAEDFVLYVNYFGVCGGKVDKLAKLYPNLIVDCAQAYFATPKGRASFSSPRKFFGVPDGGVAYGVDGSDYVADVSDGRMAHLVERLKNGPTRRGYVLFHRAETSLDGAEVFAMSSLTKSHLAKFNLQEARERRYMNFNYLRKNLPTSFPLDISEDDVPMVYPYVTKDRHLRSRLIDERFFVALYWPGIKNCSMLSETILPLPIDQRYSEVDMMRMSMFVRGAVK